MQIYFLSALLIVECVSDTAMRYWDSALELQCASGKNGVRFSYSALTGVNRLFYALCSLP